MGLACFLAFSAMGQPLNGKLTAQENRVEVEPSSMQEANFNQAFQHLKAQDQLQFELVEAPAPPKLDWLGKLLKPLGDFLSLLIPLFQILFWVFMAGGTGLLLYIIGKALWNYRLARVNRDTTGMDSPSLYRPSEARARILLAAVDALAKEGRFAEAIHQLLFRSVQDLSLARPNMIRRSYTSREIARLPELTPETRKAFSLIATEVERSHFGGRPLDEAVFQRCRIAYAQFTTTELDETPPPYSEGLTV